MSTNQTASDPSITTIALSQLTAVTGGRAAMKNDSGATVVDRNAPRGNGGWKGTALKAGTIAAGVYGLLTHQDLQPKKPEHPESHKPPVTIEQPIIPTEE